jgi:hypothetical protein
MSKAIRSRPTRPSRYSWKSTPSSSHRRPVGANPGGSSGPVCVAQPRQWNAARGSSGITYGPASNSNVMSGNARHVASRNVRTSACPCIGCGQLSSWYSMSSVISASSRSGSCEFHASSHCCVKSLIQWIDGVLVAAIAQP